MQRGEALLPKKDWGSGGIPQFLFSPKTGGARRG